jgi:integrase
MKIPEPKYLLRQPKIKGKTQINLIIRYDNNKFVYYTGERVIPQNWDFKRQRIKKATSFPEYSEINQWLNKLENDIISIFRELRLNKIEIDNNLLKQKLDEVLGKSDKKNKLDLFSFIEDYIETNKKLKSEGTIKVYQTTFNHLNKFQKIYKTKLCFKSIDLDFYDKFMDYFLNELKFSSNTAGKYLKTLKVFLNEASERGINKTTFYKSKKFKRISMSTDKIYLTDDEILDLYNLELDNTNEELIKDLFVLSCQTGLRFSDVTNVKKENIISKGQYWYINIITQKTKQQLVIPLTDIAKKIVIKHDCNLIIRMNNQSSNKTLKELAFRAGITNSVTINESIGGKLITNTYLKHELVSWHAGRRSFATNSFKAGVPAISIMKITGHQTEKVFLSYIRITNEENAELLTKQAFYN